MGTATSSTSTQPPSTQAFCFSSSLPLVLLVALLCLSLPSASLGCVQDSYSCIVGFHYQQQPGVSYSNEGCVAANISVSAPFGLSACCQSHTACYHNCTQTRTQCDSTFTSCMTAACDAQTGDDQSLCNVVADGVEVALTDADCGVYSDAQAASCECSNGTSVYFISAAQHRTLSPYAAAAVMMLAAVVAVSSLL